MNSLVIETVIRARDVAIDSSRRLSIARWAPLPLRLIVGFGFMQHMRGRKVDRLNAAHVEDHVAAAPQVRSEFAEKLVRCAEEEAALELADRRQPPFLPQNFFFCRKALLFRGNLISIQLPSDHGSPDLFAHEKQDGESKAGGAGNNEVFANRNDDHRRDDEEVHDR